MKEGDGEEGMGGGGGGGGRMEAGKVIESKRGKRRGEGEKRIHMLCDVVVHACYGTWWYINAKQVCV